MGVLIKNKINYSGSGMDSYESPNLDYDSAVTLTLPDYTGYSYTMPADGVIMTRSYGSVGSTVIITNSVEYGLSYRNDTWSVVFIPFEKGTVMTIRRGSSNSDYSSGSWIKFIPYKVKFGGCTPLHEYSSNEHIVGTWVDGSPIYERTLVNDITNQAEHWYVYLDTLIDNINDYTILNWEGTLQFKEGSYIYAYMSPNSGATYYINRNNGRWYLYFHSGNATCDWGIFTATIRYIKKIYGQPTS